LQRHPVSIQAAQHELNQSCRSYQRTSYDSDLPGPRAPRPDRAFDCAKLTGESGKKLLAQLIGAGFDEALTDGRLTIVSPFPATEERVNADLARRRNRFIAALAEEMVFAHISPGGNLAGLRDEIRCWD